MPCWITKKRGLQKTPEIKINGNLNEALAGEAQSQWQRPASGSRAMAEAAGPTGESQSAEVKTQQPAEKGLRAQQRRDPRSVYKVSQLLLPAIASHRGLPLAALKEALGKAGYEVRRKSLRPSGQAAPPEGKGALLLVCGSQAAGSFRVWKVPKPKREPTFEEGSRASRKTPARPRSPRRRRPRRQAARKAGQVWRRSATAHAQAKRARPQTQDQGRPGSREAAAEGSQPRTRAEKRSGSKPKQEKHAEKVVKRTVRKPTDRTSGQRGKTSDPRAACAKAPAKSECSGNATGNS
ncbi:LOW QUALITY PROTEIN: testis-specific H1 histone-like [Dasypus novemcinctus]|uniref:LOW QUALITY PROTEIN: testis-specific H1 histone-like n=1 Tax=Dasypus novemcinctus TaxID=9361 RepID=UPI0039C9F261